MGNLLAGRCTVAIEVLTDGKNMRPPRVTQQQAAQLAIHQAVMQPMAKQLDARLPRRPEQRHTEQRYGDRRYADQPTVVPRRLIHLSSLCGGLPWGLVW
jgi:hypothetical protein